jgi:hypothetical protein
LKKEWAHLTKLTGGRPITIERVSIDGEGIAIEGPFELPPLARLKSEDQVFVAVFVKSHGSIKQMEKHFGISYPTVKSRLNRIGDQLEFVDVETTETFTDRSEVLDRLARGEIGVDDALKELKGEDGHE